uniref:Uncharacterized protein n=1 Tax=Heterorhabditis bacteriophora TaxID=37862 RepID=A0A1I7W6B8_HETBA
MYELDVEWDETTHPDLVKITIKKENDIKSSWEIQYTLALVEAQEFPINTITLTAGKRRPKYARTKNNQSAYNSIEKLQNMTQPGNRIFLCCISRQFQHSMAIVKSRNNLGKDRRFLTDTERLQYLLEIL